MWEASEDFFKRGDEMKRVLVVEDNSEMRIMVKSCLEEFEIAEAATLSAARQALEESLFDLIVLDLQLPDGDGSRFLAEMQGKENLRHIPVFVLTGRTDTMDKVLAFSIGAEDFITKPFDPLELKARVQAKLRKLEVNEKSKEQFLVEDLRINTARQRVWINDDPNPVPLTSIEYRLLLMLSRNRDRVISRQRFLDEIWGNEISVTDRTVDTHIGHLRKKIRSSRVQIETVIGEGYRLK